MFDNLRADITAVMERDPAAKSRWEVLLCYPSVRAMAYHRVAHRLYLRGHMTLARWISQHSRHVTGIEIHPGACIGKGFFIDHGDGVVIGETTVIGDNVTLYQGVTLGGTGKEKGKRHPTIGNNVVVASGAKVLGSFTVGDHAKIGAGSVVLKPVPAYATVVGIPGRVVVMRGKKVSEEEKCKERISVDADLREIEEENDVDLAHDNLPDPEDEMMQCMLRHIQILEKRIQTLEKELEHKC